MREIEQLDEDEPEEENRPNQIYLDGYICKAPVYRMTPLGREIADVLLAVNRAYGKSDYIPCICWGRNARFAGKLPGRGTCGDMGKDTEQRISETYRQRPGG